MWKRTFALGLLSLAGVLTQEAFGQDTVDHGIAQLQAHDFSGAAITFQSVLDRDPKDAMALKGIAAATFQAAGIAKDAIEKTRLLDEATRWNQRMIELNVNEGLPYYSLGVIAWTRTYPELRKARTESGMKPQDSGPLSNANVRQRVGALYGPVIQEGVRDLEKAIALDSNNGDAMAYLNLLLRSRADIDDTPEQAQQDLRDADRWVNKSMSAKRRSPMAAGDNITKLFAPVPPPPPPLGAPARAISPGAVSVEPDVLAQNLLVNIHPDYPDLAKRARIQGTVRFNVRVGKDGHPQNLTLVSGHPLLVAAAQQAVQQFVYRPFLVNGAPADVVSVVDMHFTLNQ